LLTDANAVAAIAKEAGFIISADDMNQAQSVISEEKLMAVDSGFRLFGSGEKHKRH
jgi:predicted ribosomally synthesized peptide with nif11-like leader